MNETGLNNHLHKILQGSAAPPDTLLSVYIWLPGYQRSETDMWPEWLRPGGFARFPFW